MSAQPFGIAFTGTRKEALARLDALRDANKQNLGGHASALADVVTEACRATIQVAGMQRENPGEPRVLAENVDDFRVDLNASAHVADDGTTNVYVSCQTQNTPARRGATLAEGPTPNEQAAYDARAAIQAAAARAAAPETAPAADTAATSQPAPTLGTPGTPGTPVVPVPVSAPGVATTGRAAAPAGPVTTGPGAAG